MCRVSAEDLPNPKRLPDDERKRLRRALDRIRASDAGLIVRRLPREPPRKSSNATWRA